MDKLTLRARIGLVVLFVGLAGCGGSAARTPAPTPEQTPTAIGTATPAPTTTPKLTATPKRTATPKPTRKPTPTPPLLDVQGNGVKTTQTFSVDGDWALSYAYDCSNFGQAGTFAVFVYGADGTMVSGGVSESGTAGRDVSYVHQAGSFYLSIISECAWHVVASK